MISAEFRFDAAQHVYVNPRTGGTYPSITTLLKLGGLVDDRWYTDESRDRGSAVHQLTADYDYGALEPAGCVSPYRGWLLGYVAACVVLRPVWDWIEVPAVHPVLQFAGRPDRAGVVLGLKGVTEIKTGRAEQAHAVQTALQAILVADTMGVAAESLARYAVYVSDGGRFKVEQHTGAGDFRTARTLIRRFC